MRIEPAGMDDVETLAGLWVDLARDQRLYRSHLRAESNRAAIAEAISQSVVTDGVRIARRTGDDGGDPVDGKVGAGDADGAADGRVGADGSTAGGAGERPHPPGRSPATAEGVLGFVMFGLETGGYEQDVTRGVVHNLYVRPPHRDRGVGSALLDAAESALAERGADVVSLEAMLANQAAVRFYRRNGYRCHRVELEKDLDDGDGSDEGDGAAGEVEAVEEVGDVGDVNGDDGVGEVGGRRR